jgi:hypothetical protein
MPARRLCSKLYCAEIHQLRAKQRLFKTLHRQNYGLDRSKSLIAKGGCSKLYCQETPNPTVRKGGARQKSQPVPTGLAFSLAELGLLQAQHPSH